MSYNPKHPATFLILSVLATLVLSACSEDCEVCPQLPNTKDITVAAAEYGPFCATYFSGGDYDFAGHGPAVYLEAAFYVSGDSLMFYFFVDATETQSNWTRGAGRYDRLLYLAPEGYRISAVDTPLVCKKTYVDINHEMDFLDCGDIKYRGYGDCEGNDIGTACVCTRYWVWIRDIVVEIARE